MEWKELQMGWHLINPTMLSEHTSSWKSCNRIGDYQLWLWNIKFYLTNCRTNTKLCGLSFWLRLDSKCCKSLIGGHNFLFLFLFFLWEIWRRARSLNLEFSLLFGILSQNSQLLNILLSSFFFKIQRKYLCNIYYEQEINFPKLFFLFSY